MKKLPKVKSTRFLHQGYITLKEDLLEQENGSVQPSTLLLCKDATVILAQDKEGRWILNREYRHATGEILLGCPGGGLEPNEDPIAGGKREFFEETGYVSDDVTLLGVSYPSPALLNQKIYYLLAKNALKKDEPKLEPFEFIETVLFTDQELKEEIQNGAHIDGLLLTALCYFLWKK